MFQRIAQRLGHVVIRSQRARRVVPVSYRVVWSNSPSPQPSCRRCPAALAVHGEDVDLVRPYIRAHLRNRTEVEAA